MPTPGPVEILIILAMLLVPIGIVVWVVRLAQRSRRDPAMDALRTAFARGEIDEAEFERRQAVLQRG